MKNYEIMYIVKVEADISSVVEKVEKHITANNGIVIKTDQWGEKTLAYHIGDEEKGFYVLVTFEASAYCVKELDRLMRISEEIMRHMIIAKG